MIDTISQIFPELEHEKVKKLLQYAELLNEWNSKINLISRKDIDNTVARHIIPSLAIARVAKFSAGEHVMDIGTGGGLPGIPLAIACQNVNFTLVDSIGKKIVAVNDMIKSLELKNVSTINSRAEQLCGQYDKIVARAVTNLKDFLQYSNKLLKKNGKIFYLKGGDCSGDLKLLKNYKLYRMPDVVGAIGLDDKVILEI